MLPSPPPWWLNIESLSGGPTVSVFHHDLTGRRAGCRESLNPPTPDTLLAHASTPPTSLAPGLGDFSSAQACQAHLMTGRVAPCCGCVVWVLSLFA